MKQPLINLQTSFRKYVLLRSLISLSLFLTFSNTGFSQCGAGYTRDTINWDNLDYLHTSGVHYPQTNPVTGLPFVTTAMKNTQYFSMATNRMTIATTIPVGGAVSLWGDVATHTGETGSFGVGDDVKYSPAASTTYTITVSFQTAVQDVKFSLYDIDRLQRIAVTALDGATAKNITMSTTGATVLTLNNNNTPTANAKASDVSVANTSPNATLNIQIAGLVTSFTITVSETKIVTSGPAAGQEDGGFFLSDISACQLSAPFPTNYYQPYTQPFTGQPAYFLATPTTNNVYMVNPATAIADLVFSDPAATAVNSLAYDPVNHWLYYVMESSGSAPGNLSLKKYDFNTEPGTISTVISNLPTFGIPGFINGVEAASAAFYNGSLYLGIEGENSSCYCTDVESIVWKIDFDGAGNPTTFSQVFGFRNSDGTNDLVHDWGDISIKDGVLISHGTNQTFPLPYTNDYKHYNLETGTVINYIGNVDTGGQMGQTWNGNMYRITKSAALYNNNGTIGALTPITVTSCSPAWTGSANDASDPFKPKCDFGDAPASYDPIALSPAVHQQNCNNATLRLGALWDREWSKNTSADASGDAGDEESISTVTVMVSNGNAYNHVQDVIVLNNTGANATLGGWLDYNADGVFQASEGVVVTVPSNAAPQTITLSWTGITVPIGTPNSFLRVRLVGSGNTMTAANPTGWYDDGEVEDYPVISSAAPLDIRVLDFNAYLTTDKTVVLKWAATNDNDASGFEIQRSSDQNNWEAIGWKAAGLSNSITNYNYTDLNPITGTSYYRLKMIEKRGSSRFSITKSVYLDRAKNDIRIAPNPANNKTTVIFTGNSNGVARLNIRNLSGQLFSSRMITVRAGENNYPVDISSFAQGIYIIEISTAEKSFTYKMLVY